VTEFVWFLQKHILTHINTYYHQSQMRVLLTTVMNVVNFSIWKLNLIKVVFGLLLHVVDVTHCKVMPPIHPAEQLSMQICKNPLFPLQPQTSHSPQPVNANSVEYSVSISLQPFLWSQIDWLSMVLRLRQHNIGYTASTCIIKCRDTRKALNRRHTPEKGPLIPLLR